MVTLIRTLFLIFTFSNFSYAESYKERIVDLIVVVVNGQAITRSALENELILREIDNPSKKTKEKIIAELVNRVFLMQEAERFGIPLARWDNKVKTEINKIKSKYSSEDRFISELNENGLEEADLVEWVRTGLILDELMARRFGRRVDLDKIEEEAINYFNLNKSKFIEPAEIEIKYVLVRSKHEDAPDLRWQAKVLARRIHSELKENKSFSEINRLYGENNKKIIVVDKAEKHSISTKLEHELSQLKVGELSQLKLIPEGYLIAKLLSHKLSRPKKYEEIRGKLTEKLIGEAVEKMLQEWLDRQRKSGYIHKLAEW